MFLSFPGFPGKLHLCNKSCVTQRRCTKFRPPGKVVTVTLEQYKLETMLEEWESQKYKLDDSDNVYKCRPPEKVLTVKLEQYKLKGVLEKINPLLLEIKFVSISSWFS